MTPIDLFWCGIVSGLLWGMLIMAITVMGAMTTEWDRMDGLLDGFGVGLIIGVTGWILTIIITWTGAIVLAIILWLG
jgi:hypothetical protein